MFKKSLLKTILFSLLAVTPIKALAQTTYGFLGSSGSGYGNLNYSYNSSYSTYMASSKRLLGLNIWSGWRIDRIATVYTGDGFLSQQAYPPNIFLPVGGGLTYLPIPFGERIVDVGVGLADANNTIAYLVFKFQKSDGFIYYRSFGRIGRNGYSWWRPNLGTQSAINGITVRQGKELNFINFSAYKLPSVFPNVP